MYLCCKTCWEGRGGIPGRRNFVCETHTHTHLYLEQTNKQTNIYLYLAHCYTCCRGDFPHHSVVVLVFEVLMVYDDDEQRAPPKELSFITPRCQNYLTIVVVSLHRHCVCNMPERERERMRAAGHQTGISWTVRKWNFRNSMKWTCLVI